MNRKELKTAAKSQIKGNIGILFVISIVVYLISLVPNCIPIVGSLVSVIVVAPALALGTTRIYIALVGGKKPEVGDVFCGFKDFWLAFKVTFLTGLYVFLWSLLFVIPGYVKMFSYSMAQYIIAENPNMGANEAITLSRKMMDGHKMEAFVLGLSFILWFFLVGITFGIAAIYVGPYVNATMVNFYNKIKPAPEVVEETAEVAEDTVAE
ncbi:MAG: DUF975 family protein [Clostridia bacterium]|nr:DUF975 family protein [Clostridia bacterium]